MRLIFLAVFILSLSVSALAASPIDGTWANQYGAFHFEPDGRAAVTWAGQGTVYGQWQLSGNALVVQTPQGTMQFYVGVQGDILMLQDAQGTYSMQRVQSTGGAPAAAAPQAAAAPASTGGVLSDAQFEVFLDRYQSMQPDDVYRVAATFSATQNQWLNVWSALGADIYTRMCHGSFAGNVRYQHSTGLVGCSTLLQWEQMNSQYSLGGPREADIQRDAVKAMLGCSTGRLDAGSCSSYRSGLGTANDSLRSTGQSILDMGTCTHYRDETGKYLGCW